MREVGRPLHPAARKGETHIGLQAFDAQSVQQPDQVGIVTQIIDDEARVDVHDLAVIVDGDGVGMAPDPLSLFIEHHIMDLMQGVGCRKAGHA